MVACSCSGRGKVAVMTLDEAASIGRLVETQMRVARARLRSLEVPVPCRRRRGGASNVAGSLRGTPRAGTRIVATMVRIAAESAPTPIESR